MIPRTVQAAKAVAATFTPTELDNYGNIILNGYGPTVTAAGTTGAVGALTNVNIVDGGTGYADGIYSDVYTSGSTGSFAYSDVTVAGGIVTAVTVTTGGRNFKVGEAVNISVPGAGTGLDLTVGSVDIISVRPALKGWTNNYYNYYTELPPNAYNVNPGDPTMFEFTVHSYTEATGPIATLGGLQAGSGYNTGTYLNVPVKGGSGTGATVDLIVDASGFIASMVLNNPGTDYTFNDGLTPDAAVTPAIGPGRLGAIFVTAITVANPAGEAKWAQAPRRFFQNEIAPFVPPFDNRKAIQYSFIYPVTDNPAAPPIGTL